MKVIIDRFEGDFAIVEMETRQMVDMPLELVPEGAKEGDAIEIIIRKDDTLDRKQRIEKIAKDLWK